MRIEKIINNSFICLVYTFLYLPIIICAIYSFNSAKFSNLWESTTIQWYIKLFNNNELFIITLNSLLLGAISATGAVFIGFLGANALFRYHFSGKKLAKILILTMLIIPDLIFAIGTLLLYTFFNISLGFFTIMIAHITLSIPLSLMIIYTHLSETDKNIFAAAKDLGAREFTTFTKVTLPILYPALIAAWLLSFTLSIDDVVISFFISGPNFQLLPLYIYSKVRLGTTPEINALCTLIILVTLLTSILAYRFLRRAN